MSIFYIGLTVIALLSLWDSYILLPTKKIVERWVLDSQCPSLIYFFNCDYCKGFWMCIIGALITPNILIAFPSYGIVVIWLTIMENNNG